MGFVGVNRGLAIRRSVVAFLGVHGVFLRSISDVPSSRKSVYMFLYSFNGS